jgi:hypothetical protein
MYSAHFFLHNPEPFKIFEWLHFSQSMNISFVNKWISNFAYCPQLGSLQMAL